MTFRRIGLVALLAGFTAIFYFNAYVCDDAFIMLRVVDNYVRGWGLRWNTLERVQVFTSPLHTLLTAAAYWWTHDPAPTPNPDRAYLTAMGLNFVFSAGALILYSRVVTQVGVMLLGAAILVSSQAYVSFCSSGLESSLVYLLLVAFIGSFVALPGAFRPENTYPPLAFSGLLLLTRLDLAPLLLPPVLFLLWRSGRQNFRAALKVALLALLPLLVWLLFALIYYGFPLPNTYYAKIGYDLAPRILVEMGLAYLGLALVQDPVTLLATCGALLMSVLVERRTMWLAAGVVLHLGYVVSIGGDFLGFRFLAFPLLVAVVAAASSWSRCRRPLRPAVCAVVIGLAVVYGMVLPGSPLRAFREGPSARDVRFYFAASRLPSWRPTRPFPFAQFHRVSTLTACRQSRARAFSVDVRDGGLGGFCEGPLEHYIYPGGISDPLIARLPIRVEGPFLPAHLTKPVPDGYVESVQTRTNRIKDTELSRYYDTLVLITRAELFSRARWRAIWDLNMTSARRYTGSYLAASPPYPGEFAYRHETLGEELRRWLSGHGR